MGDSGAPRSLVWVEAERTRAITEVRPDSGGCQDGPYEACKDSGAVWWTLPENPGISAGMEAGLESRA